MAETSCPGREPGLVASSMAWLLNVRGLSAFGAPAAT